MEKPMDLHTCQTRTITLQKKCMMPIDQISQLVDRLQGCLFIPEHNIANVFQEQEARSELSHNTDWLIAEEVEKTKDRDRLQSLRCKTFQMRLFLEHHPVTIYTKNYESKKKVCEKHSQTSLGKPSITDGFCSKKG